MKNKLLKIIPYILLFFVITVIYKNWFLSNEIIGGDWPYFFQEEINAFTSTPPFWSSVHGNGLGGKIISYSLDTYLYFTAWLFSVILHIPWLIVYKFFWYGLFLVLALISSIYLMRTLFPASSSWQRVITAFLYTTNTYVLLIASGGQMGLALAFALAPLVLGKFISLVILVNTDKQSYLYKMLPASILAGIILSAQILFDLRIAYITLIAILIFWIIHLQKKRGILSFVTVFLIPGIIAILLHAFWLVPTALARYNPLIELGSAYTSISSLQFFSFATLSNTFGLLHPNWPENIFGKVSFMKPEFLLLPLLAFSSLLFLPMTALKNEVNIEKKMIIFFALIGLIGAFLAKGANEPFGQIYVWLFEYAPGFVMFRDPTKWYLLIALSYSVLISFSIYKIDNLLRTRFKKMYIIPNLFPLLIIVGLLFLIRQAVFGQIGGTFKLQTVPQEYHSLKEFLINDSTFSRTLWIPRQSRFAYNNALHPSIEAMPLFKATNSAEIIKKLRDKQTSELLKKLSVAYVIVPYDSVGEIFQKDRKYDQKQYEQYIKELEKIAWLRRVPDFGKVIVFRTREHNDHISLQQKQEIHYQMIKPYQQYVEIETSMPNTLIFSENYSSNWRLKINNTIVTPEKTAEGIQSYRVPAGTYSGEIIFTEHLLYRQGLLISFVSFCLLLVSFFVLQYTSFFVYLKNTF